MTMHFPERKAVARVANARSRPPTYDANHVKLREGVPEKLVVKAFDRRPEGVYPTENPCDVLMGGLEEQF